jgi:hypothetical protein
VVNHHADIIRVTSYTVGFVMWGSGNYRQIEYFKYPNVITVQIVQVQVVEFAPMAYYLLDTSQSIYRWFAAEQNS